MRKITKENKIRILQFAFAVIAFAVYITYSLLANPISQYLGYFTEWHISRIIYAVPYIACLLIIAFSRHKNPRKLSSLSVTLLLLSFIPSYMGILNYSPLVLISNNFSDTVNFAIFLILFFCGFVLTFSLPVMEKSIYLAGLLTISVMSFSYAMANVYIDKGKPTLNMLAFSFLVFTIALFGLSFDYENQYEPKYYKLMDIDSSNYINFDYIIDGITDSYLTDGLYPRAVEARSFYYAIKDDDKKKLAELNITGKSNIASIFELWLKFEKDYPSDKEPTIFFNLCKYMISDRISNKDFDDNFYLFCQSVRKGKNKFGSIDIVYKGEEPANILSNLYDDAFVFEDIKFASTESFLQGLKFRDPKKQAKVFAMSGKDAKKAGKHHNWWKLTNNLYYKGKKINRYSKEYDRLITVPFASRFCSDNGKFKQALLDTELKNLEYSRGKTEKYQTVLTQYEFLNRINFFKRKVFDEYFLNKNIMEEQ